MMKKGEVCLVPELVIPESVAGKLVVVIDVYRASSSIVTGLWYGADHFKAVTSAEEARHLQQNGYHAAGERGGITLEGFQYGNSPFEYQGDLIKGQKIAITTSNGTRAISAAQKAAKMVTACFLNLKASADYINRQTLDVLLLCSGWHGKISLEDTTFAGALMAQLTGIEWHDDDSQIASYLYQQNRHHIQAFLKSCSHATRLVNLGYEEDLTFCTTVDKYPLVASIEEHMVRREMGGLK